MTLQYIRTDKNGTKIYHNFTCTRCGGAGGADAWAYTGWTCYKCGGTGKQSEPEVIKEYTPEYRAKLDARAEKRRAKKMEEAQAKKAEAQAEWKQKQGFVNDRIYIVGIRNSFEMKDSIKEAGGRYNGATGWYFSEPHEEFNTIEMTAEECLDETVWGNPIWKTTIHETIESRMPQEPETEYYGQVGEKVDMDVTLERRNWYDTKFGTTWVYTFKDDAGHALVWKTSVILEDEINEFHLKGTIKEHSEYRGIKQTVLTRCKVA